MVFVAHCLLNENVRFLGGATRPGAVCEAVEPYLRDGVGIVQLPCPEQHAWGGVLKRWMLALYGRRVLRWYPVRRPLVVLVRWATAVHYGHLARRTAREIIDYVSSGFEVVGVVGVGKLRRHLARHGVAVPFREHDLLAELRAAGSNLPAGRRDH